MSIVSRKIVGAAAVLLCLSMGIPDVAEAVPAYARQTGMNCNSCHVGTDNVPNFTRTGRLFAMRAYTKPYIRDRLRHDGDTVEGKDQYGGDYLALNMTDYFSARFISEVVQGGKSANGTSLDTSSNALGRMAMFFTGAITDWLGLWTEIGYLGNNSLHSVTEGQQGPTGVNFFAYDEYRLAAAFDLPANALWGDDSFWGMSIGNEHPNVVGQFNFPLPLPDMWYNGQGGLGRSKNITSYSLHGFFRNRLWLQMGLTSGADNTNLSDGSNIYTNVALNFFRKTRNDLWVRAETYFGNDFTSVMTPVKDSFICPGTCPPGVSDSSLSITNSLGFTSQVIAGAPVEEVDDFFSYKLTAEHVAADRGDHTWYAAAGIHGMEQDFVSGGKVERVALGASLRYFWRRTYGFEVYYRDNLTYEYTTPTGLVRDTKSDAYYGITGYWNPAMNFSVHLRYNPIVQNTVFKDQAELHLNDGESYSVGFEYNF